MKFKTGDYIVYEGEMFRVYGVGHPWGNKNLPEEYQVGKGEKFLPGFTGCWVPIEELDSKAEIFAN